MTKDDAIAHVLTSDPKLPRTFAAEKDREYSPLSSWVPAATSYEIERDLVAANARIAELMEVGEFFIDQLEKSRAHNDELAAGFVNIAKALGKAWK